MISGQTYNMHTTHDEALIVYETMYANRSIGRNPQFDTDRHNSASATPVTENAEAEDVE